MTSIISTSVPPNRQKQRSGSSQKVSILPFDVTKRLGGSLEIEVMLLRGTNIKNYLNQDGTLYYEGTYSTATASIGGIGGFIEYEHEGILQIVKENDRFYTLLGSHCLSHIGQLVHGANAINEGTQNKLQKYFSF